jgi:hypothetical protein
MTYFILLIHLLVSLLSPDSRTLMHEWRQRYFMCLEVSIERINQKFILFPLFVLYYKIKAFHKFVFLRCLYTYDLLKIYRIAYAFFDLYYIKTLDILIILWINALILIMLGQLVETHACWFILKLEIFTITYYGEERTLFFYCFNRGQEFWEGHSWIP